MLLIHRQNNHLCLLIPLCSGESDLWLLFSPTHRRSSCSTTLPSSCRSWFSSPLRAPPACEPKHKHKQAPPPCEASSPATTPPSTGTTAGLRSFPRFVLLLLRYLYIFWPLLLPNYAVESTVLNKKTWLYGTQSVLQYKYHESMTGSWEFKRPINITFGQKRPPAAACIESLAGTPHVKPKLN